MTTTNDGMGIPISRRATCVYCGTFVDTNANGTYRRTVGWLPIGRYANNRQGSNSLALRQSLDHWACAECIDRIKHGISPGQQSLFPTDLDDGRIVPAQSLRLVMPNESD